MNFKMPLTISETSGYTLDKRRHDAAHVLAQAVKELFPDAQTGIGPAIEDGFYYDFKRDIAFSSEDLPLIEKRMQEIIQRRLPIVREEWSRAEALHYFQHQNELLKCELIQAIPADQNISVYRQGDFVDLCRGPHSENTGLIGSNLKLQRLAGAYWKSDHRNPMLQRIYGTVFATADELNNHLERLKQAELRDHRKLGRELDLFHFQEDAPGAVFWHPKGWRLFNTLLNYLRAQLEQADYQEINTPDIMDRSLWEKSGHWEKFADAMFTTATVDDRVYALKPMNCPGCVQVYRQGLRSYRELPLRLAEFGKVHRFEPSGSLHGLMRLRAFTQDDAHIFCTETQLQEECQTICQLILKLYRVFGFNDIRIKFSDRPPQRVGEDSIWDKAEQALLNAVAGSGLDYSLNPGEGAFYGPKLEFVLRDAIGRDWQCGTLQVDFNLPGRLDAHFVGEDSQKHTPVMLHRALFGSLERFIGILIEHYAGWLPLWLAPIQLVIAPISETAHQYAISLHQLLRQNGWQVELDLRNEKPGYKVRTHTQAKIPLMLVVGKQEAAEQTVSLRKLNGGEQIKISLEALEPFLKQMCTAE